MGQCLAILSHDVHLTCTAWYAKHVSVPGSLDFQHGEVVPEGSMRDLDHAVMRVCDDHDDCKHKQDANSL